MSDALYWALFSLMIAVMVGSYVWVSRWAKAREAALPTWRRQPTRHMDGDGMIWVCIPLWLAGVTLLAISLTQLMEGT